MIAETTAHTKDGLLKCENCDSYLWRLCLYGFEILWCNVCRKSNSRSMRWN